MDSFEIERYELVKEKMNEELSGGIKLPDDYALYFSTEMKFVLFLMDVCEKKHDMKEINSELYRDIVGGAYGTSYCNPTYACSVFGDGIGRIFSVLAYEIRCAIGFAAEGQGSRLLIRAELLMEVYGSVTDAFKDGDKADDQILKDIIYWYVSDYYDVECEYRVSEMVDENNDFATRIVMESNLDNSDYLYQYGEYITDNEIEMSRYMSGLSQDRIDRMAHTFSEGYRIGFINTGKDISKKKTVNIRYPLGMERVVRTAINDFEKMGLKPVIYRAASSLFRRQNMVKVGFFGANPNKQYDYDHAYDEALILDGQLVTRRLECLRAAFDENAEKAGLHGGPAVIEIFGDEPFTPESKVENLKLSEAQQSLSVKMTMQAGKLTNEYIKGEERSFTIIAFPSPAIGSQFKEIFDETLEINTLDYYLYRDLQQKIIDTLDKATSVHIVGAGSNKTDLLINLTKINNPEKETVFENCVADVNIPVGEVFTSPRLSGTNGVLNVSRVFLNELEYINLTVDIKDGKTTDYSCDNYEDGEKGRNFFKENVLFNHESLPIGEFAIGTNTRAYAMGRRFGIEGKLPILIAEKTGPHFALGDTCYSHAEDVAVYNPDGKEIISRDNEVSITRKTDPEKAYFGCHTDITLPYDEVGLIEAICEDGRKIEIIKDGRFVLPGLEELNIYL